MHENAMTRGESHHTRRVPALALVFSAALVLVATLALLPVSALAMTTNKATARPNEDGGSGVIGAMDTRLTWEGTVGDDEEVSSITLSLPEGATFDHASTRITVLDGLNRTSIDGTATSSGNSARPSTTRAPASPCSTASTARASTVPPPRRATR